MTTGKINQVAFLRDTMTHTIPNANETRGRDGRGSHFYRARVARTKRPQGQRPISRHRICITCGPVWRESARLEHEHHCQVCLEFHQSGYATQEPRLAARYLGPWADSDGSSGLIVQYTSTPPKKITEPDSLHAKPHECRVSRELVEKKEPRSLPQNRLQLYQNNRFLFQRTNYQTQLHCNDPTFSSQKRWNFFFVIGTLTMTFYELVIKFPSLS